MLAVFAVLVLLVALFAICRCKAAREFYQSGFFWPKGVKIEPPQEGSIEEEKTPALVYDPAFNRPVRDPRSWTGIQEKRVDQNWKPRNDIVAGLMCEMDLDCYEGKICMDGLCVRPFSRSGRADNNTVPASTFWN